MTWSLLGLKACTAEFVVQNTNLAPLPPPFRSVRSRSPVLTTQDADEWKKENDLPILMRMDSLQKVMYGNTETGRFRIRHATAYALGLSHSGLSSQTAVENVPIPGHVHGYPILRRP
jgi:hypothetical protein